VGAALSVRLVFSFSNAGPISLANSAEAFMSPQRTLKFASAVLLCALASPAFASNRDMVQLQTQVQQLQDAVARLQQSNDERMGVMKDLIQQSADSVNRMSQNMDVIQKQLADAQTAQGAKSDQLSGQVQALNDSIDEMRTRMTHLEKLLTTVESEQQTLASGLQSPAGATPSASGAPAPAASASPSANEGLGGPVQAPIATKPAAATDAASAAPLVGDLYKAAYRDYIAAHYSVANSEFNDVIKAYPDNNLAGNAWFFLGEMEYRAGKYAVAASDYDNVLERFPANGKIPASHLHKAQALFALRQNDAGIRQLRTLIQRYPVSPEATQARKALRGMSVPVTPR